MTLIQILVLLITRSWLWLYAMHAWDVRAPCGHTYFMTYSASCNLLHPFKRSRAKVPARGHPALPPGSHHPTSTTGRAAHPGHDPPRAGGSRRRLRRLPLRPGDPILGSLWPSYPGGERPVHQPAGSPRLACHGQNPQLGPPCGRAPLLSPSQRPLDMGPHPNLHHRLILRWRWRRQQWRWR